MAQWLPQWSVTPSVCFFNSIVGKIFVRPAFISLLSLGVFCGCLCVYGTLIQRFPSVML